MLFDVKEKKRGEYRGGSIGKREREKGEREQGEGRKGEREQGAAKLEGRRRGKKRERGNGIGSTAIKPCCVFVLLFLLHNFFELWGSTKYHEEDAVCVSARG
jgi:hypothetical protein